MRLWHVYHFQQGNRSGFGTTHCAWRSSQRNKAVTIDDILKVVCKHFDLEPSAIHTKSRKREVVQARQIAMYLAKNHTDFSTSKIGKFIGNKDHATVLHACKTVKGQLEVDKSFHAEVQEIESLLKKRN